jgi:hypothetical protein
MKLKNFAVACLTLSVLVVAISAIAQVKRPFHNGSVWNIAFIRMKPGMETAYLNYLAGPWKANQEAMKKEGVIVSYKVITAEGHTPGEWNVMLMTEYKNLATMEANEDRADDISQKVVGDDEKQRQGYRDRLEIREVMGDRLAREVVLAPKTP